MNKLDFQLGKIKKINQDGTVNIQDFRTGGQVYTNVTIEHNAINQQQPVEGQNVLFFTADDPNQNLIKVVRLYGSNTADKKLVISSPQDMDQGEGRMVSQTGATVYVGNGGVFLYSGGQSFLLLDEDQLMELICQNLDIVTLDGFEIKKGTDGTLTIKKGTLKYTGETRAIENPTVTITIQNDTVTIDTKNINLGAGAQEPAVLGNTLRKWLINHTHTTPAGPSGPPIIPFDQTALSHITKVK